MQKAMTLMNLQLSNAISVVAGVTGQKIVRAIVAGERDPQVLAAYRDSHIKATEQEVAASLLGNWRDEHLFKVCGLHLTRIDGIEVTTAMTTTKRVRFQSLPAARVPWPGVPPCGFATRGRWHATWQ
jgi:hypothetical protein